MLHSAHVAEAYLVYIDLTVVLSKVEGKLYVLLKGFVVTRLQFGPIWRL